MTYYLERYGPIAAAAICASLIVYFRQELGAASTSGRVNFDDLYSAVFDWSAIQTGFLFGIFGYVGGKSTGFIAEIRETPAMEQFFRYTKAAMALGFVITFYSVPLIVTGFKMHDSLFVFIVFCVWCFLSVWGFFAFARVAYLFGLMVRPKDQQRIPA
ncbi:MAG: hypothetical protein ACT6RL_10975 [Neoaquamicrobium sediminum]|uniref:hypothetical protein n=1 Tax=Neoaquamicrobium sediminum TaxID=1849104 RepID=UPI004037343C